MVIYQLPWLSGSPSKITKWNKMRVALFRVNPYTRSIGSGRIAKYPELYKEVYGWIIKQRNKKIAVKYARIRSHAKREATKMGLDVSDFKFSDNWKNRFCNRYKLSSRCKTHQA